MNQRVDVENAYLELDEKGENYTGRVVFPKVNLGRGDIVEVTATLARVTSGDLVIVSIGMNVPMNTRRLKALPWKAMSQQASDLMVEAQKAARRG